MMMATMMVRILPRARLVVEIEVRTMWGRQQTRTRGRQQTRGKTCEGINWAFLAFEFLLRSVELSCLRCRCLISVVVAWHWLIVIWLIIWLIVIFFLALRFFLEAIQILLATSLEASPNGAIYAQEARRL
jgi:hypothetical protein